MTPREQAALEKHMMRTGGRSQSNKRSASATPERTVSCSQSNQRSASTTPDLIARRVAAPLDESSRVEASVANVVHERVVTERASPQQRQPLTERAATQQRQPLPTKGTEASAEEDWVKNAANPKERAERRRQIVQSKLEQIHAHEKSRVFVFKRREKPSNTSPSANEAS
jgi:hypothetical protein